MAKKIRLTWSMGSGNITEECFLIDNEAHLYVDDDSGNPTPIGETTNLFASKNWVVFEDEEGIFILDPKSVVYIEVLE